MDILLSIGFKAKCFNFGEGQTGVMESRLIYTMLAGKGRRPGWDDPSSATVPRRQ